MEKGLTPIQIDKENFIQDNGFDSIPIFLNTQNPNEFKSLIEEQSKFFGSARPENRPELPKNPTLKEMKEYKEKFLNPTINFDKIDQEIREKIKKSTHRLSPDEIMTFFPDSKNVFELTQDPLLFEFRAFTDQKIREQIEKDFKLNLKEIPVKEQVYFLTNITQKTNENIKPVQDFAKNFGEAGIRTFLSIEQGSKEMGDKILELGEKLEPEVAKKVFAKYGEIIDTAESVGQNLEKMLPNKNTWGLDKEIDEIKKSLLLRAKDLLVAFYGKKDVNSDELLKSGPDPKFRTPSLYNY